MIAVLGRRRVSPIYSGMLDNVCLNTYIELVAANRPAKDLQEELKMTRPFKRVEEELLLNIVRTAAVFEHDMADALKPATAAKSTNGNGHGHSKSERKPARRSGRTIAEA